MSVKNLQSANETNFNSAFVSKTTNNTIISKINLQNPDSDNVDDIQSVINEALDDILALESDMIDLEDRLPVNNMSASIDPTTGDDSLDGYAVGSLWYNAVNDRLFIASDVSEGAAIWNLRGGSTMFKTVSVAQLDFSSSNVTDSAYTEFVADTGSDVIRKIEFFYPDGDAMILAVGAASSEVDTAYVLAGGNEVEVEIPANSRLSFKLATGGTTNDSGILSANLKAEA